MWLDCMSQNRDALSSALIVKMGPLMVSCQGHPEGFLAFNCHVVSQAVLFRGLDMSQWFPLADTCSRVKQL